nr:hypothetical protein [Tanacetum cinerariifolium]
MMIYLRNVAGFKIDYFKGITYDDIRPIFEKYFDSNVAFLQKTKERMEEEDSRALKRLSESQEDKAAKKQKLDEEVEELKRHLQIVPNDEDDVYTEAIPLALKIITFTTSQLILLVERRYPLRSAAKRRKRVVIKDPEEYATPSTIIHTEVKSKDKGKGILVEEPKPLKKQAQIEQDEAYAREKNMMIYLRNVAGFKIDYFKGITYDDIRPIFEKYFDSNVAFLQKTKERMEEEDSRALKRLSESQEDKAAKKQKLDEEVEELKRHLQIVPNDEDDVYTEAIPLALKLILLVERRYPLRRFTLDQMLNNVRIKVEEESEVRWVCVLDMQVTLHDKRIVMQVTLHYEAIVMQVTLHDKRIVMKVTLHYEAIVMQVILHDKRIVMQHASVVEFPRSFWLFHGLFLVLLLHLAGSQPMLKSSYKAKDGVIISIPPLAEAWPMWWSR